MSESAVKPASDVVLVNAVAASPESENRDEREVELHLEGEDDYGLHLRDHRLHLNGANSMLSDIRW